MKQGTNLGSQIGRWIVLAAVVALLGALLLTIRPVGAQESAPELDDPTQPRMIDVPENSVDVAPFKAYDPDAEDKKIFWTLSGVDAGAFTIGEGDLKFKKAPDYENPTDLNEGTPDVPSGVEDNTYKVTVRFGSGGQDDLPAGGALYDGDDLDEIEVTVNVRNEDEPGMVVISSLQPQVGTELTATLSDEDVHVGTGDWQWARSDSMNGPFTDIEDLSDKRTYIPTEDDLGKYLQVTVVYVDNAGPEVKDPLKQVTAHAVRKDVSTTNDPPQFPDQSTLGLTLGLDGAPARAETERFILENSGATTPVGAPVTAFDDAEIIELLTYKLSDGADAGGHDESFRIHAETGQITVSPSAKLGDEDDGRNPDPDPVVPRSAYEVTVTATDGDGSTQDINVSIWVVGVDEPPMIGRNYVVGIGEHADGDRVPTEMSHYELDRNNSPATGIDTDLDTEVEESAIYVATDHEDNNVTLTWSLAGDDATRLVEGKKVPVFKITSPVDTANATLAFAEGPDFEKPWNKNTDQVYEVTIVVTDSVGNTDELPVTVKVINSTEDNKPGKVTLSNRVPEVNIPLKAELIDPDTAKAPISWQWYRAATAGVCPAEAITPVTNPDDDDDDVTLRVDDVNQRRHYVENETPDPLWVMINTADAKTVNYRPKNLVNDDNEQHEDSDQGKCLRATVTYKDGPDKFDPTEQDDAATDGVNESLEGTWVGTEYPVKAEDKKNNEPVFTDNGTALDGMRVIEYRATRLEGTLTEDARPADRIIDEVKTARDIARPVADELQDHEEDSEDDTLTYSLGGTDAKHFVILGSVEYPTSYDPDGDASASSTAVLISGAQGTLIFKLNANGTKTLDYETKSQYVVTVFATDPSGDGKGRTSVKVTVDVTDVNEEPRWVTTTKKELHEENDTDPVFTFKAEDKDLDSPDTGFTAAGMTYDLVPDATDDDIEDADIADHRLFKISSTGGVLKFKSPPNYEDPQDVGDTDNKYQVTVRATAADIDDNPSHTVIEKVTVTVTDMKEAPVFPETLDELDIEENADDLQKEPRGENPARYLVNRGVGEPGGTTPTGSTIDVGIPVLAKDDDSTSTFAIGGYTDTDDRDRIDGLTYELMGSADALEAFDIVPATGQILTREKLDHEIKSTYEVTVKATDPSDKYATVNLTINVTNVEEKPIPVTVQIAGASSHSHEENSTEDLGDYTASATGTDATPALSLGGADKDYFTFTGTAATKTLKFKAAPDYENPRGQEMSEDNSNTYTVTVMGTVKDKDGNDVTGTKIVTITVTNVEELGALSGPTTASINEGDTDVLGTYTLTGGPASYTYFQSLEGDDAGQFTLNVIGTTGVLELSFSSAPDYEAPADADGDNTYEVTVKATGGGEETMVAATVTVANVEEGGTVTLTPARPSVGTEITATLEDGDIVSTVTWSWGSGDNADGTGFSGIGTNSATYTPVAADVGKYIGAWATYNDGYDTGNIQNKVSESVVTQVAVNAPPAFSSATATRTIAENTAANTIIGSPVAATDPNDDPLTYRLEGTDAASFSIDSTGQLRTSAALDFETKSTYNVVVRASDPAGLSDTINVTITVTDVVEVGPEVPEVPEVPAIVQGYDTNLIPGIQISELFVAIDDYFAGGIITLAQLFQVIDAYFE